MSTVAATCWRILAVLPDAPMCNNVKWNSSTMRNNHWGYFMPRTRLTTPLVRKDGELVEATWDEALARVAEGFEAARIAGGEQAFGMFSCSKSTNEMNYAAQKFARKVMGSNNIDSCNRT